MVDIIAVATVLLVWAIFITVVQINTAKRVNKLYSMVKHFGLDIEQYEAFKKAQEQVPVPHRVTKVGTWKK